MNINSNFKILKKKKKTVVGNINYNLKIRKQTIAMDINFHLKIHKQINDVNEYFNLKIHKQINEVSIMIFNMNIYKISMIWTLIAI